MSERTTAEKAADDLRKQQEAVAQSWREHPVDQTDGEVHGFTSNGSEKKEPLEIHAVDRRLFLNTHGEIVLDQTGVVRLRKLLDQAFQTVS